MKKFTEKRFCKNCKKETLHSLSEDALEITVTCTECSLEENIVKTMF
ncbi:hypothetical protein [Bacillus sp. MUM 13]|nr:hypothetical protein [Bacillus sp. MUM 13]